MKLIIDIPEEAKQAFDCAESNDLKGGYYDHGGVIGKAIQNGTPLDNVKAEIQTRHDSIQKNIQYDNGRIDALEWVLEILDNIGNAESEKLADVGLLTQSLEDVIDCS